ncbi:MAG: putative lipid II flippase FtsW [Parcubacteria group bacterium CG10_big_fil_rev_8_21_14_0_10_41_35]|nr:MAG: putative lipid II flippase FtsW [Parcubacteria group bacterium CG10_big_fil_rev_8_21_14_0_10_41_35]
MMHRKESKQTFDKPLFIISGIILIFGLIMLYSASVAVGLEWWDDSLFYVKRQLIALIIGAIAGYVAYKIDYHAWEQWSLILLLGSFVLLILVLIPGFAVSGQGAQRWLNLGFFAFQPSELVKLTLILYMSAWLSERGPHIVGSLKGGFVPFVSVLAVLAILIILEPDLGTLIIICAIGMVMYFLGGARLSHVLALIIAGSAGLIFAIKAAPYRMARFTVFINPSLDPQGAGYHIKQALLAVGSGGFTGLGLGHSRQKFLYLPEVVGDSLFAVIAEEMGFVFSVGLVCLFLWFFWRSIKISQRADDSFGRLVAIGIGIWICTQAFVNIGAMLSILPLTGLTLPLMSYGRSSLIITMASIGILLNVSKK